MIRVLVMLSGLLLATAMGMLPIAKAWAVELTPSEQQWLEQKGEVVFVSQTTYPPFEFVDESGLRRGLCIELAQWIATEYGFKARFVDMPFEQAQQAILSGEADVLTSFFYSDARDKLFDFTQQTWQIPALIFVPTDRLDIVSMEDLSGKRVALQRGDYAKDFLERRRIPFEPVLTDTMGEAIHRVIDGDADALVGDEQIIQYHLYSHDHLAQIKATGEALYLGSNRMATVQGADELRSIIDKGIAHARENGIFGKIERKWLGYSVGDSFNWAAIFPYIAIAAGILFALIALVVGLNVQLRKTVERRTRALKSSEQQYQAVCNDMPGFICRFNADGYLTYANDAYCRYFGLDPARIEGFSFLELVRPEERTKVLDDIKKLTADMPIMTHEHAVVRPDGEVRWQRWTNRVILDESGQVVAYQGVGKEVSPSEHLAESMRKLFEQMTPVIGQRFFPSIVEQLSKGLDVSYAYIGRLDGDNDAFIRTEAFWGKDGLGDNFAYPIEEAPCGEVVRVGFLFHPRSTYKLYAHEKRLNEFKIEAYMGMAIKDKAGVPIGLVGIMHDSPREDLETIVPLFKLVVDRVSAEFERLESERSRLFVQEQLAHERALLHCVLDSIPDTFFFKDLDGVYLGCNRAFEEYVGLSHNEIIGKTDLDMLPRDIAEFYRQKDRESLERGKAQHNEEWITYPDGRKKLVDTLKTPFYGSSGELLGLVGTSRDITERKRHEAERERMSAALEQAAEAILITDAKGSILYANPAFSEITGYDMREIIGKNPRILKSGKQDRAFYKDLWETITSGERWSGHFINRRKDGSLYTEDATIAPVLNSEGEIVNYVGVKRDITRELNLEEQLRQSQKMEAVGQLAGGVAHDFNNLLQVIAGYNDLAIQDLASGLDVNENLQHVAEATNRASRLISQLLAFSRKQNLTPEVLDVNSLVSNLLKMVGRIIGEQIRMDFLPAEKLDFVRADRGMIEQVIMNLCVNARDAMPEGGTLTLKTFEAELDDVTCDEHPGVVPGRFVCLSVIDSGVGMSLDLQEHIFEPFFTSKEAGRGTGLGLATVYGTIRQHNGLVTVTSEPGRGSEFRVYLPVQGRVEEERLDIKPSSEAKGGNEMILLAEDEKMVRQLGKSFLEKAGYRVIEAENGAQAIAKLDQYADQIDLLILDVVMPYQSGKAVYEHLLEKELSIPVFFCSGYSGDVFEVDYIRKQGLKLLQKPYDRCDLLAMVRQCLDAVYS